MQELELKAVRERRGLVSNEIRGLINFFGDRLNQPKSPKPPAGIWRILMKSCFSNYSQLAVRSQHLKLEQWAAFSEEPGFVFLGLRHTGRCSQRPEISHRHTQGRALYLGRLAPCERPRMGVHTNTYSVHIHTRAVSPYQVRSRATRSRVTKERKLTPQVHLWWANRQYATYITHTTSTQSNQTRRPKIIMKWKKPLCGLHNSHDVMSMMSSKIKPLTGKPPATAVFGVHIKDEFLSQWCNI